MPLSDAMKMQFEECFVIKAQKAVEIEMPALAEIMRSMGQNPTTDEVKALFDKVAGGESSINSAKMLTAVAEFQDVMTAKDQLTELADAFAVFDKDKSGSISGACVLPARALGPACARARPNTCTRHRSPALTS